MKSKVLISYFLVKQTQTGVSSGAARPKMIFLNHFLKIIFKTVLSERSD